VLPTATHKYNHATEHDWWLSHQARAGVPGEATTLNTSDASSANQQRHDGDRAFDSTTRSSTQQTIKGTE
jgi:hypothetical protein